jgi:ABC-type antimicrobial peptide transport system permease subunit
LEKINFERLPRQAEYNHFKETLKETFGDRVSVKAFDVKDTEQLISINSIITISIIIGVLVALDTVLIYSYIISKRRKDMAVFGIVGAKRRQRFLINQIEIMALSVIVALVGYAVFRLGIQSFVVEFCDISVELYNDKVYGIMMIGYIVSVFVITYIATFINTRKNIVRMLRGYKNA